MTRKTKGGPSGPSGPSGKTQSYRDRIASGRRQLAIWLTPEASKHLDKLGESLGMLSPRDVVVWALSRAYWQIAKKEGDK